MSGRDGIGLVAICGVLSSAAIWHEGTSTPGVRQRVLSETCVSFVSLSSLVLFIVCRMRVLILFVLCGFEDVITKQGI